MPSMQRFCSFWRRNVYKSQVNGEKSEPNGNRQPPEVLQNCFDSIRRRWPFSLDARLASFKNPAMKGPAIALASSREMLFVELRKLYQPWADRYLTDLSS